MMPNSESNQNLIVMYHYVRPSNSDGVTGLTPQELRDQLALVCTRYRPVTAEEYVALRDEEAGMALITFDDAVSDQYDYAFPILEDLDVPAILFAPMRPYSDEEDPWSTQHLLHALAHHLGWTELERRIDPRLPKLEINEREMNDLYNYEVPEKRRLKYLLAFALNPSDVRAALGHVNAGVGLRVDDWFMSALQLLEVQSAGHGIGGHGFDHVPYETLSPKRQAADMHRAQQWISRLCGSMTRQLAYPYGSCTRETEAIARGCGYSYCYATDDRVDAKYLEQHFANL
jgi:peptidoglycan/xylan/chitin deacetylase (PgdA/CDA1 family)